MKRLVAFVLVIVCLAVPLSSLADHTVFCYLAQIAGSMFTTKIADTPKHYTYKNSKQHTISYTAIRLCSKCNGEIWRNDVTTTDSHNYKEVRRETLKTEKNNKNVHKVTFRVTKLCICASSQTIMEVKMIPHNYVKVSETKTSKGKRILQRCPTCGETRIIQN